MQSKIVTINLGHHEYDIYIGAELMQRVHDFLPMDIKGKKFFLIADENTCSYAKAIEDVLMHQEAAQVLLSTMPAGELTKSFDSFVQLCHWMLDHRASRDCVVLAIGGGVIGDLAGYVAASVLRGVPFVQIPTTLLAQVDSSVGGKTGINAPQGKNLIGAFYQPEAVIIDIETLKTLPPRELLAGYAEIVKYALIGDYNFFEWLEEQGRDLCRLDKSALFYAIEKSVQAKANIVIADEKEKGRRALLNLGHTFGHALEAACAYDGRLLHGEAVAIGIVMAYDLSARLGYCSRKEAERVENHFVSVGLPTRAAFISPKISKSAAQLFELMQGDKKVKDGKVNFVMPGSIGNAFVTDDVPKETVLEVLENSLGASNETTEMVKGRWKQAFSSLSSQS